MSWFTVRAMRYKSFARLSKGYCKPSQSVLNCSRPINGGKPMNRRDFLRLFKAIPAIPLLPALLHEPKEPVKETEPGESSCPAWVGVSNDSMPTTASSFTLSSSMAMWPTWRNFEPQHAPEWECRYCQTPNPYANRSCDHCGGARKGLY